MTQTIIKVKELVKKLLWLGIPNSKAFLKVQTGASELGYGGILKQKIQESFEEQIVIYNLCIWHPTQQKYSTVKKEKEISSIVWCLQKFQDDLFNKKFLIRIDCKAAPNVMIKDV